MEHQLHCSGGCALAAVPHWFPAPIQRDVYAHTGFAHCRVEASCKGIFFPANMLDNVHLNQSVQASLHLFRKWPFVVQCVDSQEVLRSE